MLLRGILLHTVRVLKQICSLICFHGQILKLRWKGDGDVEEEKEKAELIMNDDLTAKDPPLLQLQSVLCTESSKVFI